MRKIDDCDVDLLDFDGSKLPYPCDCGVTHLPGYCADWSRIVDRKTYLEPSKLSVHVGCGVWAPSVTYRNHPRYQSTLVTADVIDLVRGLFCDLGYHSVGNVGGSAGTCRDEAGRIPMPVSINVLGRRTERLVDRQVGGHDASAVSSVSIDDARDIDVSIDCEPDGKADCRHHEHDEKCGEPAEGSREPKGNSDG